MTDSIIKLCKYYSVNNDDYTVKTYPIIFIDKKEFIKLFDLLFDEIFLIYCLCDYNDSGILCQKDDDNSVHTFHTYIDSQYTSQIEEIQSVANGNYYLINVYNTSNVYWICCGFEKTGSIFRNNHYVFTFELCDKKVCVTQILSEMIPKRSGVQHPEYIYYKIIPNTNIYDVVHKLCQSSHIK